MPDWKPNPGDLVVCPLGRRDEQTGGFQVRPREIGTVLQVIGAFLRVEYAGGRVYDVPRSLLMPYSLFAPAD